MARDGALAGQIDGDGNRDVDDADLDCVALRVGLLSSPTGNVGVNPSA